MSAAIMSSMLAFGFIEFSVSIIYQSSISSDFQLGESVSSEVVLISITKVSF